VEDVVRDQDSYYIVAAESRADERARVLKHGETFLLCDAYGDIMPYGLGEEGLYHEGTRYLSRLELRLGKLRPLLLSSTVRENNDLFPVDLTNPDLQVDDHMILPRGILHIFRAKILWRARCYEHLRLSNHGLTPIRVSLLLRWQADFADIFEVRGTHRALRGEMLEPELAEGGVRLRYRGLDDVLRATRLTLDPPPAELSGSGARYDIELPPQEAQTLGLVIACEPHGEEATHVPYEQALFAVTRSPAEWREPQCRVHTSNEAFNHCSSAAWPIST